MTDYWKGWLTGAAVACLIHISAYMIVSEAQPAQAKSDGEIRAEWALKCLLDKHGPLEAPSLLQNTVQDWSLEIDSGVPLGSPMRARVRIPGMAK